MCGITGWFACKPHLEQVFSDAVETMTATLRHRGPDDRGVWIDAGAGIALGHTRLSILDLTAAGHQPMVSHCGRFVLSFNGEIYNHSDLRSRLTKEREDACFSGHSDTETLLAGIAAWGLESALRAAHGMFALALWDRKERRLSLARDRIGEKPLFYGKTGDQFLFGSELKALAAHPRWDARLDPVGLDLYLRFGYIPAPHSIFSGIAKVNPGEILAFECRSGQIVEVARTRYWRHEVAADDRLGEAEAIDSLDRKLRAVIRGEMLADVPVGAFLSGGIDSSLVVALMQQESPGAVQTFTIGFDDPRYDEADHARAVAAHLGTRHEELRVTADDALAVIPELPDCYDEPFADASAIPTIMVSRLARTRVTVALSGDGGDELFGGYNHYRWGCRMYDLYRYLPYALRSTLGRGLGLAGRNWRPPSIGTRLARAGDLLGGKDAFDLLTRIGAHWQDPSRLLRSGTASSAQWSARALGLDAVPLPELFMLYDKRYFLPDDIMVKVDRATMAVSLESRAPFLDHGIAEFAASLPLSLKIRDGKGKWLLRQLLRRYVPDSLTERPKMGFGAPVGQWLREPLRPWADALLDERRLRDQAIFDAGVVCKAWGAHRAGRQERGAQLWNLLMFQAWLDAQPRSPSP